MLLRKGKWRATAPLAWARGQLVVKTCNEVNLAFPPDGPKLHISETKKSICVMKEPAMRMKRNLWWHWSLVFPRCRRPISYSGNMWRLDLWLNSNCEPLSTDFESRRRENKFKCGEWDLNRYSEERTGHGTESESFWPMLLEGARQFYYPHSDVPDEAGFGATTQAPLKKMYRLGPMPWNELKGAGTWHDSSLLV